MHPTFLVTAAKASVWAALMAWLGLPLVASAAALSFPSLTGRVVDQANLLAPGQESALTAKLEALEARSSRQLVVATVPSLGGTTIEDYGNRLFRHWAIGQARANNGALFLIAPNERKVRIEVGYGLEPILTDAFTGLLIQNRVLPAFRQGDFASGIATGADGLIEQLQAPPEVAERRVLEARQAQAQRQSRRSGEGSRGGSIMPLLFWGAVLVFVILPMLRRRRYGRRYRGGGGGFPVILWGPGLGGGWSSGGGFSGGGGFGGGFSGGGGSSGGGGASGSW